MLETSSIEIDVRDILEAPISVQERRSHGIWLTDGDVSLRTRHLPGHGIQAVERYNPCVGLHPLMTSMHICYETFEQQDRDVILQDMKIESLLALQERIEQIVVEKMLVSSIRQDAFLPPSIYISQGRHRPSYIRCRMNFFPTKHLKRGQVLTLIDYETYHHLFKYMQEGENPEAIRGKIQWVIV